MKQQNCILHMATAVLMTIAVLDGNVFSQARAGTLSDGQVQTNVLRSLSGAPDLVTQAISATTLSGTVTLSGSVHDDAQRTHAEQLVAKTLGVQKVVDELTVNNQGTLVAQAQPEQASRMNPSSGGVLQSDGTYAADDGSTNNQAPQVKQGAVQAQQQTGSYGQSGQADEVPPPNGPDTDPYGRPLTGPYGSAAQPSQREGYPAEQQGSPTQQVYGAPQRQPYGGPPQPGYAQPYGQGYGQPGEQAVTLPIGALIRVRVNQHLSSRDLNVGTAFDAMVVNDVVADGQVAIPRGAFVQGTVVEATSSGHLKGQGELGLQLTQVTLGGRNYPIVSDVFSAHGGDKTIQSVNSAVGLGALGAIFGAVAGGGAGAAIGAGIGGVAGLGASAASGRGDVFIPSEAVLTFRLTQPAGVTTVSQTEMQRLAYSVSTGEGRGPRGIRRYPYPYYGGPVIYPRYYYRPYGYSRY